MQRFHFQDLQSVERTPTSPAALRFKLGEMILSSSNVHAKVEALNPDTGEYRIVLQGTLGAEGGSFGEP
jgi:hypothetical protein